MGDDNLPPMIPFFIFKEVLNENSRCQDDASGTDPEGTG